MEYVFYARLFSTFMLLNDHEYLLEEFNDIYKKKSHIKIIMYGCFIVLIFYPTHPLQILVYTISAQVARLTTLPIDFSIKLPSKWYIATCVPWGMQQIFFEGLT